MNFRDAVDRARGLLRGRHFSTILLLFAVAALAAGISVAAVDHVVLLTNADNFIKDWEFPFAAHEQPSDDRVRIVSIDEATLHDFPYRSPIDRGMLAELLTRLDESHPRAIGVDVLFDQPTEPAKDAALERVIRTIKTPLVIAYTEEPDNVTPKQLAYLRAFVPEKDRATPDLPKDSYGVVRTIHPGIKMKDGHYYPSFERALAGKYGVKTADKTQTIVWRKPPKGQRYDYFETSVKTVNAYAAPIFKLVGPAQFADRIVLVGSDLSLTDRHRTPLATMSADGVMPGVFVHAYGLSTLLDGAVSPFAGWKINLPIALVLAFLGAVLGVLNFHLAPRIAILAVILVGYSIAGLYIYYYADIVLGLLSPSLAMVLSFIAMDSLTGLQARRQRFEIQGMFSRYLSPKVVEFLVAHPERASLEAERRVMTYLFTDIADFTTFSENMDSRELAVLINEYLEGMTQVVQKHDGMVDKFIGDAVFAIFNVPVFDLPDHAARGVKCALDMDHFTLAFQQRQREKGLDFGITRIGVLTGPAAVGNFGSKTRLSYTAQGDAVNAASRLEGLNKQFGTHICVAGETRELCKDIEFREIASVILKGKTKPTMVWEPLHPGSRKAELNARYRAAFAKAAAGAPEAKEMFAALAAEAPEDSCIKWHADRLAQGITGVEIKMTEK
ncbi:MAG TPA: adenylate/guanylate cyclase domain-containing protein [Rhizomicrobium sp.]|nr:adenylate/guanylate cyclase domain-containing protein [Rhizomicrobium sp.]